MRFPAFAIMGKATDPERVVTGHVAENIGLTFVRFYVYVYVGGTTAPVIMKCRVRRAHHPPISIMPIVPFVISCAKAGTKRQ